MYPSDDSSQRLEDIHSFIQPSLKEYYVPGVNNSETISDPQGIWWSGVEDQQVKKKLYAVKQMLKWMVLQNVNGSSLVTLTGLSFYVQLRKYFNQHSLSPYNM